MATNYDEIGRRVDLLDDSAGSSERAKRINSLSRTVGDIERQSNERKMDYSKEISSLTNEQRRMLQKLELQRDEFTTDTMQSYNTVVKGLGSTINRLATGIKYITTETAKATKDAIGQYARAVGEDISINKQNTVAMALSSASPIFGYFASKFMETDIFRSAADRIREKLGAAVSGGFSRLGRMVGIKKKYDDYDIPSMQRGGYVKKGGMIKVHAAEVVMPAEKVMQQIDKAKNTAIARQMGTTMADMSETLETIQEDSERTVEKTGNIVETFLQEYQKVKDEQSEVGGTIQHVVSELKEIKTAMFGMEDSWGLALERTLDKHPFFKGMYKVYKFFNATLPRAFRWIFGRRGKYAGDVAKASSGNNVYDRIVGVTGLLYTGMMPKLDELIKYVKELTEFTTGKTTKAPKQEFEESRFEKIVEWFKTTKKQDKRSRMQKLFDYVADQASDEDDVKEFMKEKGITSFSDLLHPTKILEKSGVSKEVIGKKSGWFRKFLPEEYGTTAEKNQSKINEEWKKHEEEDLSKESKKSIYKSIIGFLKRITKAEEDREEREGPHSPSMADNISVTAEITKKEAKRQQRSDEKQLSALEKTHKSIKGFGEKINEFAKKAVKQVGNWLMIGLMFAFNMLSTVIATAFSALTGVLGGLLSALGVPGLGTLRKLIGGGLGKIGFKKLSKKVGPPKPKKLTEMGKTGIDAIKDAYKTKGIKGAAGAAGRTVGQVGGTALGRGVSSLGGAAKKGLGALGPGIKSTAKFGGKLAWGGAKLAGRFALLPLMAGAELLGSGWDAISAIMNPQEFAASRMAAGVGAFFGGKDTGWSGAASGAMKWGTIGAAAGSIIPGIGTMVGGGLGALLGAIVGFVGGKNLAKGIDWVTGGVKAIISGLWEVIKFPFQAIRETVKSIWVLMKWGWKKTIGPLIDSVTKWFTEWWESEGAFTGVIKDTIKGFSIMWDGLKTAYSEIIGVFSNLWDAITSFASKAKDFIIDKLSALGPVWNWIKDYVIKPVQKIREGKVAEELEQFLNDESPVKEMGNPTKVLMSEIANASAAQHRANQEASLEAMKKTAEETTAAIKETGEENKQTTQNSNVNMINMWKNWANSNTVNSRSNVSPALAASHGSYSDRVMFGRQQ